MLTPPPHSWAKRPEWDEFLAKAIDQFLANGGVIIEVKSGRSATHDSKGNMIPLPKKAGRKRLLPPMTVYQRQVYYKLMKNGIEREEALRTACALKVRSYD